MKKVVLLTGVIAAGFAATPVTAKADVASAPQIHEGVIENATVATEKLLDLLNGLDYDLAALKKQIHDKTYSFVGMEDEAQKEAIDDIVNIATQIEKSRQDFYTLKAKFDSHEITEEKFVEQVNEMIYHPVLTREQAQKNLVERYVHLDQDWKLFRGFQQKGDELWGKVMDVVNGTQYKGVDEIKDVFDKHEALNTAAKAYRTAYLANHENRTKVWNHSNDCHTDGKQCLVEAEGNINNLYAKYLKAYEELDALVKKYYTDQTTLKAKVDNVDPSTYTKSVDGIDTVEKAQKAANDFINTFNAGSVADWEDYLTGEDTKAPAFKEEAEYVKRAEALIKALNDAVAEAKANEAAYQKGLTAIAGSQKDLDAIKDEYYNTPKENVAGYVYRALIDGLQTKINNEKNGLVDAWNNWDFTVATDPVNAVEYVADKDFNKVKGEIADLLTKIQKNEAANEMIHQMTAALQGHYTELNNAVAGYEDVSLSQYAADGLCAHGEYLGTTNLDKLLDEFIKTEQKKYDAIESDAYLKNETAEGPTAKKNALDHELEMTWNAIATDQCAKYLAKVEAEYNTKHAYCEGLDDVCNEVEGEGAPCNCTEEDREANPCGWCDATARGMHDAIETAKSAMDGQIQEWHFATDAKNHVAEVKTYKNKALTDIENWVNAFEDADRLHDKNLDDLKVVVDKAVHNVHELYADARHDLDNYKEGDLAAANLWAQGKYGVDFKGYVQLLEELYETAQVAADDARAKHHFTDLKAVGTECDKYATESDYRVAVQANNATNDANLVAIADLETLLNSVVINEADVYPADYTSLDEAYQAIVDAIDKARTDANAAYVAGKAGEFILPTSINSDIIKLQNDLKTAQQKLADNKAAAAALYAEVGEIEAAILATNIDSNLVYSDDESKLSDLYDAALNAVEAERDAIDAALAAGTAVGYTLTITPAEKLAELQAEYAAAKKLYAENVAARTALYEDLKNAETLLASIMVDAHQVYGDDFTALDNMVQAIRDLIDAEPAKIEQAFNEKVAPEYVLNAEIGTSIINLQTAVKDYEEFKATNDKNYAALVEATKDLLASLDDVKYVSDDVYELLPATEAAADLDQESIEAAREAAKTLANTELTALETALATGKLYSDSEVAAQQAKIDEVADALEALKEQVKAAEDFRRANAEANDKLEEKVQTLVTIINTAKANSVCDLCNDEDTADLEAELDAVYEILGNVAESFAVGHLAMPTAADSYAKYMQDLTGVEANVQATLDEIAEHKVRQINDQNAYNVLQKALTDVDLALANIQLEEGWENFAVRGAHADETGHVGATSNQTEGLKYLNELTDGVNDLKALIETQHSHEGGHVCEENKIEDMKAMQALIKDAKTLIEAIHANEAAHKLIMDRFDDLYADALDAYNFWHTYYTEYSTLTDNWYTANKVWVEEYNGELEPGEYLDMLKDMLHDSYVHGAAAYDWTKDAKGEELNDKANTTFAGYDADLAKDRNDLAHKEAINHYNAVRMYVDYEYQMLRGEYDNYDYWTDTWTKDPFTADVMDLFLDEIEGEFGIFASLNTYLADIEAAFAEGVMEDAINIDERNHALGIHQQLGGVKSVFNGILAEYKDLFEDAHHLTNGKKIYSDQEYFTLGFFKKANDGSVENGQEMFKEVKVLVNDDIRLYDSRSYVWNDMGTPDDWSDDEALVDEKGRVVYDKENNPGEIAEVTVLTVGQKSNELSFNFHQNPMALERATLKAGTAEVDFLPGSISVKNDNIDTWVVKHTVSIDGIDVLAPEVAEMEITPYAASNKLIVRLDAPIDLTYTINSLVARTDDGTEFSYADRELNYAARTIEFTLPEGTASVELPEGFFTFRTGENTIARSAAMTVTVGTATSIEGLIAMGDKAQIFDLQGRRVKAEALISGNTYVVNGEKVMVK